MGGPPPKPVIEASLNELEAIQEKRQKLNEEVENFDRDLDSES
jgi:hypothetical protein